MKNLLLKLVVFGLCAILGFGSVMSENILTPDVGEYVPAVEDIGDGPPVVDRDFWFDGPLICESAHFQFQIVTNRAESEKMRYVEIYVDPTAFNEANLRVLFGCLSNEVPKPGYITAKVETDWFRLHIPGERGTGSGLSGDITDPHEYDSLQAVYHRWSRHEFFLYSPFIKTHISKWKLAVIRGRFKDGMPQ